MACVAAITLTACSGGDTVAIPTASVSTQQQSEKPSATPALPADYDELKNMSSGETAPPLASVAAYLGLTEITFPWDEVVKLGFVGVAPLEKSCIVLFSNISADMTLGTISASVMSRYDRSLTVVAANLGLPELKAFLDSFRAVCSAR